jgi:hypothetical protein
VSLKELLLQPQAVATSLHHSSLALVQRFFNVGGAGLSLPARTHASLAKREAVTAATIDGLCPVAARQHAQADEKWATTKGRDMGACPSPVASCKCPLLYPLLTGAESRAICALPLKEGFWKASGKIHSR